MRFPTRPALIIGLALSAIFVAAPEAPGRRPARSPVAARAPGARDAQPRRSGDQTPPDILNAALDPGDYEEPDEGPRPGCGSPEVATGDGPTLGGGSRVPSLFPPHSPKYPLYIRLCHVRC